MEFVTILNGVMAEEERENLLQAEESDREDLEWLSSFKEGNRRAFDFFVRKYQRRLFCIIYNMTSNREDAADLLQEVFVKAFRSITSFKGDSRFYTWLYRITVNTTITFLKKARRQTKLSLEDLNVNESLTSFLTTFSDGEKGDQATLLKELQEKLNEALQKLSLNHRTVVVLFEIEGMSHAEIARTLKCSDGTVRSRLHYAKEQLKQLLTEYLKKDE